MALSVNVLNRVYCALLQVLQPEQVKRAELMSRHTYVQLGGKADIAVFPETYSQVQACIRCATRFEIPYIVLGNGSNLIIRDGGIRALVIAMPGLSRIWRTNECVVAQGGATVIQLARYALENHLKGLEFACGIPGTVGGAVYMNAGAYGGEMVDVLESVRVLTNAGELRTLSRDALDLGYRHSSVAVDGLTVLEATYRIVTDDYDAIKARMDDYTQRRMSKQPLEYPSCGSVFKRPPNDYAGRLIAACGLQGTRFGGAQVSTKHAGFIVNVDHATAADYIELIRHIQVVVKDTFGVALETEVQIIGEDE